jgi:hypothetical protein
VTKCALLAPKFLGVNRNWTTNQLGSNLYYYWL